MDKWLILIENVIFGKCSKLFFWRCHSNVHRRLLKLKKMLEEEVISINSVRKSTEEKMSYFHQSNYSFIPVVKYYKIYLLWNISSDGSLTLSGENGTLMMFASCYLQQKRGKK